MKKRAHERKTISLPVEIFDPPYLRKNNLVTKDISQAGAFVLLNKVACPPVGRVVSVRIPDMQWGVEISTVSARVVHVTDEGMGIHFLDFDIK